MDIEGFLMRRIRLPERQADEERLARSVSFLVRSFDLEAKVALEPETLEIVHEMYARVVAAYWRLPLVEGKRILDIACGSSTSKAPAGLVRRATLDVGRGIPGGAAKRDGQAYSSLFEPWLCRILSSLGAQSVGIDCGDLSGEGFEHYEADLGAAGALDFLPSTSFDAAHDSRLFGSPEFTARFAHRGDVLRIAREIARQEERVLREGGIILHSDAHELVA